MDLPHPGGFAQMLSDDAWQLVVALHRHGATAMRPSRSHARAWTMPASQCRPAKIWWPGSHTWRRTVWYPPRLLTGTHPIANRRRVLTDALDEDDAVTGRVEVLGA